MNFDPQHKDMKRHVASGIINSGLAQVVNVGCQFGSIVILSRLLLPSDFGILAMVGPLYAFTTLLQDLGLNQATIQRKNINNDEMSAFFWINAAAGSVLAVMIVAVSPLVGSYYGEPRVVAVTAAMGMLVLVGSFANQPVAILTRRMEFGSLAINAALGSVVTLGTAVCAALVLKNYWALYCATAAGVVVPMVRVWIVVGWRPSRPRPVAGLRDMLRFGAGVTTANLSSFLSRNMDNVLIGRQWGGQALGLYDRAYKLLLFPLQRIVGPVMTALVPVLSRLADEPRQYREIFIGILSQLMLVAWPGIIWAGALADTLVPALLGKQWSATAPIFVPLAVAGLAQVVNYPTGGLYISQGRSGEFVRWAAIGAIINILAFIIGLPYGPTGVARAYALSEWGLTPLLWYLLTRRGPLRPIDLIRALTPQLGGAFITASALIGFGYWVHLPPFPFLASSLIVAYTVFALTLASFPAGRIVLGQTSVAGGRVFANLKGRFPNAK